VLKNEGHINELSFPSLERVFGDLILEVESGSELGHLQFPRVTRLDQVLIKVDDDAKLHDVVLGDYSNSS
jgi:hypothetical protein